MKRKFLFAFVTGILSILASCVTTYQPKGLTGGYEDYVIDSSKNIYGIRVSGNAYTSMTVLQQYAQRRSHELCKEKGFSGFSTLSNDIDCSVKWLVVGGGCEQEIVHQKIQCKQTEVSEPSASERKNPLSGSSDPEKAMKKAKACQEKGGVWINDRCEISLD